VRGQLPAVPVKGLTGLIGLSPVSPKASSAAPLAVVQGSALPMASSFHAGLHHHRAYRVLSSTEPGAPVGACPTPQHLSSMEGGRGTFCCCLAQGVWGGGRGMLHSCAWPQTQTTNYLHLGHSNLNSQKQETMTWEHKVTQTTCTKTRDQVGSPTLFSPVTSALT
jgi:hypothetical protein